VRSLPIKKWIIVLTTIGAYGCAANGNSQRGIERMIARGEYKQAAQALELETARYPKDATVRRLLGISHYHLQDYVSAENWLTRAWELDPHNAVTHFYLGMLSERTGDLDAAAHHYEHFLVVKKTGDLAKQTRHRLVELRLESARQFSRKALVEETAISPGRISDSTVGVVYFNSRFLSDALQPLTAGLAELLTADLARVGALRVVERIRINQLLAELQVAHTAAFDTSTAPRLGKLLRAAHILGGAIVELPGEKLRIDPNLVDTKSGEVSLPKEAQGDLDLLIHLEKQVALAAIDKIGIKLTKAEQDSILIAPTESFLALLMFSRGLVWFDQEDYRKAAGEFNRAVEADPGFTRAQEMALLAEAMIDTPGFGDITYFEAYAVFDPFICGRSGEIEKTLVNNSTRLGFIPGAGVGYDEPYVGPYGRRPVAATIVIQGQFDDEP